MSFTSSPNEASAPAGKSLHVIEVNVHRAERRLDLPMLDVYGGCRSWVSLEPTDGASAG